MAVPKGLNHLPDDLLQQAIEADFCVTLWVTVSGI